MRLETEFGCPQNEEFAYKITYLLKYIAVLGYKGSN
jgi:hypothetical protein